MIIDLVKKVYVELKKESLMSKKLLIDAKMRKLRDNKVSLQNKYDALLDIT